MAGRFEKVFSLPENLYSTGSPVIIAAGALQKDSKTGKIFAQLKLQNICSTAIKAATVQISLFDTASRPLPDKVEYQYLDINADYSRTFGEKTLIPVEDSSARSFSIAVTEVVFADQKIWNPSEDPWDQLPPLTPLNHVIDDPELLKQYQLQFGESHPYQSNETKDLWRCSCGAWNHKSDEKCLNCEILYTNLTSLDWDKLKAEKDARIEQEIAEKERIEEEKARQRALHAAKKKKTQKLLKKIVFAIISIAIVSSIAVFGMKSYQKAKFQREQYNLALSMIDDGDYSDALTIFSDLGNYEDSSTHAQLLEQLIYISISPLPTLSGNSETFVINSKTFATSISYENQKLIFDVVVTACLPERLNPLPENIDFIDNFISMIDKVDDLSGHAYDTLSSDMPNVECIITLRSDDSEQTPLYISCNGKPSFSIVDKDALIEQREALKKEKRESVYNQLVQLVENGNYKDAIELAVDAFDGKNNYGTYGIANYKDAQSYALYAVFLDAFWGKDPVDLETIQSLAANVPKDFKDMSWYEKQISEFKTSIRNFCGTYRKADGDKDYYLLTITNDLYQISWNQSLSYNSKINIQDLRKGDYSWMVQNGKLSSAYAIGDYYFFTPGQNTMLVKSRLSIDMSEKNDFCYGTYTKIS